MRLLDVSQEQLVSFSKDRDEPELLTNLRKKAFLDFHRLPLPDDRIQEWRYTRIQELDLSPLVWTKTGDFIEIALLDGSALPASVSLMPLARAIKEKNSVSQHFGRIIPPTDKLTSLHYAFLNDSIYVKLDDDATFDRPLHILLRARDPARAAENAFVHLFLDVGDHVHASILFESDLSGPFNTVFLEMIAGEAAQVDFFTLQHDAEDTHSFAYRSVSLGVDARLRWYEGWFPRGKVRGKSRMIFSSPGAEGSLKSVFFAKGREQVQLLSEALHRVPHTGGDIKNRGVLTGRASSIFQGRIVIDKKARDTSSFLDDKTLNLSPEAHSFSIPSLEIDADDVQASHGSTIGMVDEDELFYMMSRGLSAAEASSLLVMGFFDQLVGTIPEKDVQERFRKMILQRLGDARA
ncbi:MAG: SufD family Fe-S cluster assembly protein [DPANN group archaeon]|nr:SufD family Fe-S cluster assembly protein [DPANN group archaeon]